MIKNLTLSDYSELFSSRASIPVEEMVLIKTILDKGSSVGFLPHNSSTIDWAIIYTNTDETNTIYYVISPTDYIEEFNNFFTTMISTNKTIASRQVMLALTLEHVNDPFLVDGWGQLSIEDVYKKNFKIKTPDIDPQLSKVIRLIKTVALEKESCVNTSKPFRIESNTVAIKYFRDLVVDHRDCKDYTTSVYSFPIFTKSYCTYLVNLMAKQKYSTNRQETDEYKLPEFHLDVDSIQFNKFASLVDDYINYICMLVYHQYIKTINSIHFTRYTSDSSLGLLPHNDEDSDITLVINLSDSFSGGGTRIVLPGFNNELVVKNVPVGHCLMFRGRPDIHEGINITSGQRNLLIFWTSI